jgi:hypothetical protein
MSKKKKLYLAMRLEQNPLTTIGTVTCSDGIEGIMFVFNRKKEAYAMYGKDVQLLEIEEIPK